MKQAATNKPAPRNDAAARRRAAMQLSSGVVAERERTPASAAGEPLGRGRTGKKGIAIYMSPAAKEVLDRIAHEQRRSVQDLGIEALNLLFRKYRQKPVA